MERKVLGTWEQEEGGAPKGIELVPRGSLEVSRCTIVTLIPEPEDGLASLPLRTVVFYGPQGTYTARVEPYVEVLKSTFGLEIATSPSS